MSTKPYATGPITTKIKLLDKLDGFRNNKQVLFDTLTPREVEVLVLVAEGKYNPVIAAELNISRVTVQNHRAAIREKLGIKSETDYYKYALAFELISF